MGLTLRFSKEFGVGRWLTSPLLLDLAAIIAILGQIVGKRVGWRRFDSFYGSFVLVPPSATGTCAHHTSRLG